LAYYVGRNVCLGGLQNGYPKTQRSQAHNTTHNPQPTTHNPQHQDEPPPPYPPAALPTISMAIAATAPALGSAAPYDPTQGARGRVRWHDGWMVCLFRGQNETTSKNREEHGASALGGCHLAATHNNQPIVGRSGRGDVGEEARWG
jgi:hypothetical protein